MLTKLLAAVAVVVLLFGLGASGLLNTGTQKKDNLDWAEKRSLEELEKRSLKAIARRMKAEGKGKATIPGFHFDYPGMEMTLDEAVRDYSVVVADLIESKSYSINSNGIRTWYRFKITDPISEKHAAFCPACPEPPEIPEDFPHPGPDEIVTATGGGVLNVDGVELTMINHTLPQFENGKKYLLVVRIAPSRVALLGAGPAGVLRVDETERLEAIDKGSWPMHAEIRQRFSGNLNRLKTHIITK
jgi:hypothetical protein